MKNLKGIKKTVGEINNNRNLFCNVMTDNKEVWCDCFSDCNSWNQYHNKEIRCVGVWKPEMFGYTNIKMVDVLDMIYNCDANE